MITFGGGGCDGVGTDDVERVSVVADEAEQGVWHLRGETLVFLDSHQVAQVLQGQQHEGVGALGNQFAVLLLPFRRETDVLHVVAGILLAEGAVLQMCNKVVEFFACVALFISLGVDNGYFHSCLIYDEQCVSHAKVQHFWHKCKLFEEFLAEYFKIMILSIKVS